MSPINYVLGFALLPDGRVLLVKMPEDGPPHLAGLWNGAGGKVEPGEGQVEAMAREFAEEVGLYVSPDRWERVAVAHGEGDEGRYRVAVFRTWLHPVETRRTGPAEPFHARYVTAGQLEQLYAPEVPGLVYLARRLFRRDPRDPVVLTWPGLRGPFTE